MLRTMDDELRDELLRLETALAERDEAAFDGGYASVLHDDFEEFGASGRHWTRAATIDALAAEPQGAAEIRDFRIARVSANVVLALFETGGDRPARRSSLWVHDRDRWCIRFHQGTPL
jgi:ribonuclease HI